MAELNPFDQFDQTNPFDQYDVVPTGVPEKWPPKSPSLRDTVGTGAMEFQKAFLREGVSSVGTGIAGLASLDPRRPMYRDLAKYRDDFLRLDEMAPAEKENLIGRMQQEQGISRRVIFGVARDLLDPETRDEARKRLEDLQAPPPVEETGAYKLGEAIQESARKKIPVKQGWESSFIVSLGGGLGSMAAGIGIAAIPGVGMGGAGAFFTAMGSGEAVQRAVDFDRKEKKAGREGISQEEIATAGILGTIPGATDVLPIEFLLGVLKVPAPARKPLARFIARVGGQALIEGIQEGGQQFLQNLIAEYEGENRSLTKDVLPSAEVGGAAGGVAQTAKEIITALLPGRRRGGRHSGAGAEPGAAEAPAEAPAGAPEGAAPAETLYPEPAGEANPFDQFDEPTAKQPPTSEGEVVSQPTASAPTAPGTAAQPQLTDQEAAALEQAGYSPEAIAQMTPTERADAVQRAQAELAPSAEEAQGKIDQAAEALKQEAPRESPAPLLSDEDAAALGAAGYSDEQLAVMSPDERQAALETARSSPPPAGENPMPNEGVQFVMTNRMRQDLRERGFSDADIRKLRPEEARRILETPASTEARPGARAAPQTVETPEQLDQAAAVAAPEPTEAQKEAGNYQKAHVRVLGLDITIENARGSKRTGRDSDGEQWSVTMPAAYGYVKRSEGADGDQVDVYVGDSPQSQRVFIVDQVNADTKAFDEHKVMLGFASRGAAERTYQQAFSDGRGADRMGGVTEMSVDQFRDWLKNGDTTKPVAGAPAPEAAAAPRPSGERVRSEGEGRTQPQRQPVRGAREAEGAQGTAADLSDLGEPVAPIAIDFEQFAARRGASRQDIGDAGMHRGNNRQSGSSKRAALTREAARNAALVERRSELRREYEAEVAAGRIRPLTRMERLEQTAAGYPDNESTQAARRLLEKRRARQQAREPVEAVSARPEPTSEPGTEGKPQLVIPGAEQESQGTQAQRKAEEPLRPSRKQIEGQVVEIARKMSAARALRLEQEITTTDRRALQASGIDTDSFDILGSYTYATGLIRIAMAPSGDRRATAIHESWHSLERLLTPQERALLKRETPRLQEFVAHQFGYDSYAAMRADGRRLADHEVWANAAEAYLYQNKVKGIHIGLRRAFDRIARILREIRNYVQGLGFKTAEDVFEAGWEGEIKARPDNGFGFEDAAFTAREKAPPFYSALLRNVESAKLTKASAGQWMGYLKKQPGTKQEELDWLGLEDWLKAQDGAVTREAVADFVRANQVEVREVTKGNPPPTFTIEEAKDYIRQTGADPEEDYGYRDPQDYIGLAQELWLDPNNEGAAAAARTKFASYQLPGGENYRELLLTLPEKGAEIDTTGWRVERTKHSDTADRVLVKDSDGLVHADWTVSNQSTDDALIADAADRTREERQSRGFTSPHWDEPNVLAHVRFNERADAKGRRILFLEELQSDFGQQTRRERKKVEKAINDDFDAIAAKMVEAGVIVKECD